MNKQVAKRNGNPPPALFEDIGDDAKLGGKVTSADLALPFVKVLQGLSGQLKRDNPAYIKGAAIGDIVLTVLNKHWEGSEGTEVIFCHYSRIYVEWRPLEAGGGIVNTYSPDDKIVMETPRGDKGKMLLPNGNELIETAYHAVLVSVDGKWVQAVMPLKSTMLKISRKLNNQLTTFEVPDGRGGSVVAPRWVQRFKMTTGTAAGGGNDWSVPVFEAVGLVDKDTYQSAKSWAIAAGKASNFAASEAAQGPLKEASDIDTDAPF